MIRYSFNTWNHSTVWKLPPSLPEQIAASARAGFHHIGLDLPSILAHEADGISAADLRRMLGDQGITCFELVPLSIAGGAVAGVELATVAEVASAVNARQVLCVVRGPLDAAAAITVRQCARVLGDIGVGLSIEFLPTIECNSVELARRLCEDVGDTNVRVVIDSWHFFEGPSSWDSLADLPFERLGFVQFSDALPSVTDDIQYELLNRRVMPGQGVHDLHTFCDHFGGRGGDLTVSVEVLSQEWRQRSIIEFAEAAFTTTRALWQRETG